MLEKLSEKGFVFGLGAFRRYKELTGHDIDHFEQALNGSLDEIESNYRWAVMLKCANDVHIEAYGDGKELPVATFTILLDNAPQEDSQKLVDQFMDSSYIGKSIRQYYGIPKTEEKSKKKPSRQGGRSS